MSRVMPSENVLSEELPKTKKKKKVRNYSFQQSKRLPVEKMTIVNGIKIPSMPGSCYHAIIAALAEHKDKFCTWEKIIELTHRNMRMYGGQKALDKFIGKNNVKSHEQRIKDNAHTLTRTGRDCYGYRLHEQGMCIYYFKDGAMLLTGGVLKNSDDQYDIVFADGRRLQTRYRGTTMTYKEYKRFLEKGFIDPTGRILDSESIRKLRAQREDDDSSTENLINVCIELEDTFNQQTAVRLEKMGLIVEQGLGNEIIGMMPRSKVNHAKADADVKTIEVSGE
ncbi:MAG: hypothetical protein ACXAC5_01310 [Promethearchaeota archaeon]